MENKTKSRLLFILHRGWVESRLLSMQGNSKQAEDLADMLEILPGIIAFERSDDLEIVCQSFLGYQARWRSRFDYAAMLEADPPAEF